MTKLDAAHDLLRRELRGGPMPTVHVEAVAHRLGISLRTLERARRDMKIEPTQTGEGWTLAMPTPNERPTMAPPCSCEHPTFFVPRDADEDLTCAKCARVAPGVARPMPVLEQAA